MIALAHYEWDVDHYQPPAGVRGVIDLRTLEQCGQPDNAGDGFSLFDFEDGATIPDDAVVLGDLGDSLAPKIRDIAVAAIGSKETAIGGSVYEFIFELLTQHADPTGEANHKPIVPTTDRRLEIWLSGQLIANKRFEITNPEAAKVRDAINYDYAQLRDACLKGDLPAQLYLKNLDFNAKKLGVAPAWIQKDLPKEQPVKHDTTITESFNKADSGTLGPDLTWTEVTGSAWEVSSNKCRLHETAGAIRDCRAESDLSSADHYCQCKLTNIIANTAGGGPAVRFASAAATYYALQLYGGNNNIYLSKMVGGSNSYLTNVGVTPVEGELYKMQANGTSLTCYQAGVSRIATTDSGISGNLRCGLQGYASSADPNFDDFQAADLGAAAYTLTAGQGSFSLSGQAVGLRAARTLALAQGSFALTGQAAGLRAARSLAAAQGSFALTGQAAALKTARRLAADYGQFVLSGKAATLTYSGEAPPDSSIPGDHITSLTRFWPGIYS